MPGSTTATLSPPTVRGIRFCLALFMAGLLVSGLTAIPLIVEVDALVRVTGAEGLAIGPGSTNTPAWAAWLIQIQAALHDIAAHHPQLFYGMDWLAFGHVVIAVAFVGAWRDPVRNAWLFDFGLLACALVIPWALIFGELRGVPLWWRLIDCAFGVFGALPLLLCKRLLHESHAHP